jgi:hypothetical protein
MSVLDCYYINSCSCILNKHYSLFSLKIRQLEH